MALVSIGPITHDPAAELWAWPWLAHSAPSVRVGLLELARARGWDPNAIAAVIQRESGGDPQAVNPRSGASGLIQFMPATAEVLGTSVEAIRRMTATEQLELVARYFARVFAQTGQPREVGDYYLAVFWPAAIGQPDELELGRKGSPVYDQNAALDADRCGVLTAGDIRQPIRRDYTSRSGSAALNLTAAAVGPPPRAPFRAAPPRRGLMWAGLLTAGGILWLEWQRIRKAARGE